MITEMAVMTTIVTGLILVMVVLTILLIKYRNNVNELKSELRVVKSGAKSQQVKFGKSFEHFVPFIKDFPGDKEKTVFLGMPIDFICFDEDSIKFIEVKTGKSRLNPNQKRIKDLILNKKVIWKELQYG